MGRIFAHGGLAWTVVGGPPARSLLFFARSHFSLPELQKPPPLFLPI